MGGLSDDAARVMARTHARILVSVWTEEHFTSLPAAVQRLYFLLLSQPDLSLCGVLALRPKRWARLCPSDTTESVTADLKALERENYVMVDTDVDEVWIRSFIKYDGLLKSPNMRKGMHNAFTQVVSEGIRNAFTNAVAEADANETRTVSVVGEGVGVSVSVQEIDNCQQCDSAGFMLDKHGDVFLNAQNEAVRCEHRTASGLKLLPNAETA